MTSHGRRQCFQKSWQLVCLFNSLLNVEIWKVYIAGSWWEESTSNRWILSTKGQWCPVGFYSISDTTSYQKNSPSLRLLARSYVKTPGPLSLTLINFIPAWISKHMSSKVWDEITDSSTNFNGGTVEVCEWTSMFPLYLIMDVITYPCWD